MEELIKICLVNMRISTNNMDVYDQVEQLIWSCLADLKAKGLKSSLFDDVDKITDPLIIQCIKLYTKSYFNTQEKDSERLTKSYELLRDSLSLSGDYVE